MFNYSVLKRVKCDDRQYSANIQQVDRICDEPFQNIEFTVYRDPECLKGSGRGMYLVLCTFRHGTPD
jgi:hypothetical protein